MEVNALLQLMARGIGASDFQSLQRRISRMNFCIGELFRKRQGDAT